MSLCVCVVRPCVKMHIGSRADSTHHVMARYIIVSDGRRHRSAVGHAWMTHGVHFPSRIDSNIEICAHRGLMSTHKYMHITATVVDQHATSRCTSQSDYNATSRLYSRRLRLTAATYPHGTHNSCTSSKRLAKQSDERNNAKLLSFNVNIRAKNVKCYQLFSLLNAAKLRTPLHT